MTLNFKFYCFELKLENYLFVVDGDTICVSWLIGQAHDRRPGVDCYNNSRKQIIYYV